jgi:hypothetical protein
MVRLKHFILTAGLTMLVASCSGGGETTPSPSGSPSSSPQSQGGAASPVASPAPGTSPVAGASASPSPGASPALQAGNAPPPQVALIRPTDPTVRVREMRTGRNDPFASVAPPPAPEEQPAPRMANPPGPSYRPESPDRPERPAPGGRPPVATAKPPALPPLPQPDQARGVKVLGIAMVRGVPQAIVTAPDEKSTRTVVAGDRLSNGLVLVKAIDMNRAEPVVVLEQFGQVIEVQIGQPTVAQVPGKK